jgi:hypothetical protein
MRSYFRAEIDQHVNGFGGWNSGPHKPADVAKIQGRVTDSVITVTMRDGSVFKWSGGRYASRKVNLCYAPLMPQPIKEN